MDKDRFMLIPFPAALTGVGYAEAAPTLKTMAEKSV